MKTKKMSLWIIICLLITLPLGAESEYEYLIVNETNYYLHIDVDGKMYFFIPPHYEMTVLNDYEIDVLAFYSPGQDVTGEARRSIRGSYHANDGADCDCDDGIRPMEERTWYITPSDFH